MLYIIYSQHPLYPTLKGLENLCEIAGTFTAHDNDSLVLSRSIENVRDKEQSRLKICIHYIYNFSYPRQFFLLFNTA